MINDANDVGFIHDIASLDSLRKNAVNSDSGEQKAALHAAAKQFEAIFTNMLFKSMRDANSAFESDMLKSQSQDFYRQMMDDQMASEISASGSLGLADMIVAQLGAGLPQDDAEVVMRNAALNATADMPVNNVQANQAAEQAIEQMKAPSSAASQPSSFETPQHFVSSMTPYAERAAKALGVDPSLLIAQAALETGWGQKMVKNSLGNSNNLFNIKADRSWKGDKVATQTLEFHDNVPVKEKAAFRSYNNYEESFDDFVRFLNQNPRYETALKHNGDSESFIRGIHKAGYATDPNYVDKVLKVKQRIDQM
ncbi:flagellar assembly peptidoglycan hydrolase FlgJ [Vibrio sp. 99-8-1]|uniref:flagellar assembly peptidoglycan hydrolase FlgJ n=1 Tax=Vibrio sp. 99-8-1 TaxID=2607602 RepID=UPI001493B474|nr:flagellar assembly peptidoglycan hydrolase FlgJ [Vibrio sp. 99-8-1]NOI68155.1 flagellar assembly peptidoglycan hydrolase FlgJ [Vibrio sp. 99-8-1]